MNKWDGMSKKWWSLFKAIKGIQNSRFRTLSMSAQGQKVLQENGVTTFKSYYRFGLDKWNDLTIIVVDGAQVNAQALLEEFKEKYRCTRNYTLLSEDKGYSDETIFRGLLTNDGFACVLSAWQMYIDVHGFGSLQVGG